MFCPECRSEYRPGFTECASCRIPLVETLEADAVSAESWTVLAEHVMNTSLVQLDDACIRLLALESELRSQGIDTAFDPFRPGEGSMWTRTLAQPIRLMVRSADLGRALEIAAALASEDT